MDFTELYKQSSGLCYFSPNGQYLATAVQHRLVIRDSESLQILHLFSCVDEVQDIAWSPDSDLILCASYRLSVIQVWSLRDPEWTCKIDEGAAGLASVKWAKDARSIMSFSDFQLRVTIWSMVTKSAAYIQYPKFADRGYCFRGDGRYFALAERKDGKDSLTVYDCDDWSILKHFPLETRDLEDIAWSPDGRYIAVWESLLEYQMLVYYPDGRLAARYSAYDEGLGVKSVRWSPSSQFLAIGSYDQQVRILNYYTWKPLITFSHPTTLTPPDIALFRELDLRDIRDDSAGGVWAAQAAGHKPKIRYEVARPPLTIQTTRIDPDKPNPKMGVGALEFNCTGNYMVTRNDNMSQCLWIWDLVGLRQVALITQLLPIKSIKWNPVYPDQLAWCCGNGFLYLWGGETMGCEAIEIPAVNFQVVSLDWNPDGKSLVLVDKDKFCLAFLVDEDGDNHMVS
ncbi:quinon protein alcohol dehydrogenase-like superfamily [Polychytrium aggregatum]|uniref:quinon protein alcohol dehydrogenase-like superfamily n=1 Tax=Polychytrium aggregatum TaxID=110093 RepID=UPI0022FE5B88|nr:quinon protein alcohol dehydrogenase-like superfamily [Polychytrium aggregatum]KAI9202344.1 quinon protein alcohol dehydrogenase-like superfamily [Polychytrium aggregatum]